MTKTQNPKKNQNGAQDVIDAAETLAKGKAAFARMAPRMAALDDQELAKANTNIAEAALAAIGVAARLAEPDILSQFELLHASHFDMAHVHDLEDLGWGVFLGRGAPRML